MLPRLSPLLLLGACAAPVELQVSNVGVTPAGAHHFSFGASDEDRQPVSLSASTASVTVETRPDAGAWAAANDVTVDWTSPPLIDVVLVADNSGSEADSFDEITDALQGFAHRLLARNHADRIGLVRVSTESSVVLEPTSDEDIFDAAVEELFVNDGWTALWDGVRLANELIADTTIAPDESGALCYSGAYPTLVAFTDGADNNSADEHETAYDGDGVDTTLADLYDLDVGGLETAIHTVGVGGEVDEASLETLADETNAEYEAIANYGSLTGTLHRIASQLSTQVPVCFTPASCADTEARVSLTYTERGHDVTVDVEVEIPSSCE